MKNSFLPKEVPNSAHTKRTNPTRIFILGFMAVIMLGAFLLSLPISSRSGEWTSPLTALFTATSATCVTGLVLVDTYNYWNGFGQIVILCMIQIGGLGFMTIATLASFLLKRTITLRERLVMTTSLNVGDMSGVVRLTKRILIGTLLFEGIGAVILSTRFIQDFGIIDGIKKGVFHSVSAFCNAGFDLLGVYGDFSGMGPYADDVVINVTIMFLIVVGGLGFFVWNDIGNYKTQKKLSLHTKIVIITTTALILGGALMFAIYEWNNPLTMGNMSVGEKIMASFFQSVTVRTAGFNTIDQGALSEAGLMTTIILMFIGGSPGSTAGGIKTVTLAVLTLTAISTMRGKDRVVISEKTLSTKNILDAMTLMIIGVFGVTVGAFVIYSADGVGFAEAMYEAVSAFGTVGLTMGITPELGTISKIMLIVLMYLGRVGVITFGIATLVRRSEEPKIKYPHTQIMVG